MQVSSSTEKYELPALRKQPVKSLDKDAFLQLFVAQLKNQDPMSPQDSNAFMAQLAQFSILEQLTNLNKEVVQVRRAQETGEASMLLGRQVKAQSSEGEITGQVEKVTLTGEEIKVFINGTGYDLANVNEVKMDESAKQNLEQLTQLNNEVSKLRDSLGEVTVLLGQQVNR